jgi:protein TonB
MRTYTLAFSLAAHLLSAAALLFAPRLAADIVLPIRCTAIAWTRVVPVPLPPPAAIVRSTGAQQRPDPSAPSIPAMLDLTRERTIEPDVPTFEREGFEGGVCGCTYGGVTGLPFDATPPPPPPPSPTEPLRVGGSIRPPQKLHDVVPRYPALAQAARIEGVVILEAVIAEDGHVRSLRVLRSISVLDEAAMAAVWQWMFSPTLLNGQPVAVAMTVTVAFKLRS